MQHFSPPQRKRSGPAYNQPAVMLKRPPNSSLPTYRRSPLHVEVIPLWRFNPHISKMLAEWSLSRGQKRPRSPSSSSMLKRPKLIKSKKSDVENAPANLEKSAPNSLESGFNIIRSLVATVTRATNKIISSQKPRTQLYDLEHYVSAYRRTVTVSTKHIWTASVPSVSPLTTQRLGTRSMHTQDQMYALILKTRELKWNLRIEESEDTAPKDVCILPAPRGTPANLLAERGKFGRRRPYVPHDYVRGLIIPEWKVWNDVQTPADVLLLHRIAVENKMPKVGTEERRMYTKTTVDVVEALNICIRNR
ncbi:hypothetical protein C8Q70DRAFT_1077408 [Cubamyces menziesii]|uniref:Uncharacterized protein n=1 Tax=Trametes cubensis TaxID=1111947 RepID=A0AAD7XB03_9APHY|nr:hypothetical protein C8Q70DRAFT_1077408 [Cubamyces menziesii]KAJ8488363.1 hypothetical protein ONZ51_g3629 [Trametes cubensis]